MILIVYAHKLEIKELNRLISIHDGSGISWLKWRPGQRLPELQSTKVSLLLNMGFAGSLTGDLEPGEVVLVNSLTSQKYEGRNLIECDHLQIARPFAIKNNIREITLHTSTEPILDAKTRLTAFKTLDAQAVDMEAGYLLEEAESNGIPFISFKIISDHADSNAWEDIKRNGRSLSKWLGQTVFEFLKDGSWI